MKVLKVIGLGLIVASLSACSASVSVEEDAAAAGGGSGGGGSSLSIADLDGKVFFNACSATQGPPKIHGFYFNGANVYEYEYVFFGEDCTGITLATAEDLLMISVYSLNSVDTTGDTSDVVLTHVASTLTPMSQAGEDAANDMTQIGMSGSLCGLTGWEQATGQVISGIAGGNNNEDPCWDKPAGNTTMYGRFTLENNGNLQPYRIETVDNVNDSLGTGYEQFN